MALSYHIWGEQGALYGFSTLHLAAEPALDPAGRALPPRLTSARLHGKALAMQPARTASESMRLMAQETRVHHGPVPRSLGGHAVELGFRILTEGQFLLRCASGYGYHYAPGAGITVEVPVGADPDEEYLWLNGSVYAAIACLHGLYPVHASAIAHDGQVYAFTGPPGAGKSTIITGLGQRGWSMFCDDTLLLDLSDPGRAMALPGHKRLKLTDHALALTGTSAQQPVGAETGKSYVEPPGGAVHEPLPLACLVFLEEGPQAAWKAISGGERFARLADDHYTQSLYSDAQRPDLPRLFALRARIAQQVTMAQLIRPRSNAGFAASLDLAEANMASMNKERKAQ